MMLVLVLGVSNGHLASLASMHMPSLLPHNYRYDHMLQQQLTILCLTALFCRYL